MKRLIYIALIILVTIGCKKEVVTPTPPAPEVAPQTVILYLLGTSLSPYFRQNITDIKSSITSTMPGHGRILVFAHSNSTTANLMELSYDYETQSGKIDTLKRYTYVLSTSTSTITQVITDVKSFAPAESYALISGSHATGWVPFSHSLPSQKSMHTSGANTNIWRWLEESQTTRYIGSSLDGMIDIKEWATAIEASGTKMSYMIFDACFMSSIEALYDLRKCTDYVIASPSEIMSHGFPYKECTQYLFINNGYKSDLLKVCQTYRDFYTTFFRPSGCITLTACDELDKLAVEMKRVNTGSKKSYDINTLQYYEGMSQHVFYDLKQYVEAVCDDAAVLYDFTAQFDKAFPEAYRLHTPTFYSAFPADSNGTTISVDYYSGVTTSDPSPLYTTAKTQTEWYTATH